MLAKDVWLARSKALSRGTWNGIRAACKKTTKCDNPADWKKCCHEFVYQDDWEGILKTWMTPEWQRRSEVGTGNRKRVPGDDTCTLSYVRHTGGSCNFGIHLMRLEEELGGPASKVQLYERVHKRNKGKGEWCDKRAQNVVTKYFEKAKENLPSVELDDEVEVDVDVELADNVNLHSELPFDPKAWVDAIGVPTKDGVYGFGTSKEAVMIRNQARANFTKEPIINMTTVDNKEEIVTLKDEIVVLKEENAMNKEENAKMKAEVEACKLEMKEIKEMLMNRQSSMSESG